ncbi:uncharacterized protein LOC111380842 [Olea europaea var. sylvestris]|uniref:uncharacterized protein LOC111380842 n=1 Tax=Olea europaea var. sylvestris TaxID=158386 RepID=UPI000C1D2FF2|nr:uncharacterized protein LOC111380842 [Olea europaea var. sylvestris]
MDVKNAFLHGDIKEEIYTTPPPGLFSLPSSDIFIKGIDFALISHLQERLKDSFYMKDLGPLQYFLGLEVHSSPTGTYLHQHKYTKELINLAGLQDGRSVDNPIEVNVKYRKEEGDLLPDPLLYRQLQVCQFMQAPRHLHLATVRCIIRYLFGAPNKGLFFPINTPLDLVGYSDVDWAGCAYSRQLITRWCMFLGSALVSWLSKKQDRISKSSTESEYHAMSSACSEIVWLQSLLSELGCPWLMPTPIYADNTSVIQITANPVFNERTKHIEVDCHSIREAYDGCLITFPRHN